MLLVHGIEIEMDSCLVMALVLWYLEEYEKAKARGAKIYAEVVGFGMSADGYHMTMPYAAGQERSVQNALLHDAGLDK